MLLESVCRQKTAEFLTCLLHANYNCAVITYNTLSVVLLLSFTTDEVIWIKFTLNVPFSMQGKLNTKTDFQILQFFWTVHWFRAFIWFLLKNVHYHRVEFAHTNRKKNAFIFANFRFSRFKTKHYVMTGEKKNNLPFWILTKLQAFKSMGLRLTLESNGELCYLSRWETDVIYVDVCKVFHIISTKFLPQIWTRMHSVNGLLDGQSVHWKVASRKLYSQWQNVQMETRN